MKQQKVVSLRALVGSRKICRQQKIARLVFLYKTDFPHRLIILNWFIITHQPFSDILQGSRYNPTKLF